MLEADPDQIRAFVRSGGFFPGFRANATDAWLPVEVQRDKAYQFGSILAPAHAVFNVLQRLTQVEMLQVHGGSIYDAFDELGKGWVPMGSAEWITTEPMGSAGRFWYKESLNNSKSYGATSQCLTALTYAFRLTDDPWFAEIATALLQQAGASVRSISWYPQALFHLAPRH